jgi:hypothetical protein
MAGETRTTASLLSSYGLLAGNDIASKKETATLATVQTLVYNPLNKLAEQVDRLNNIKPTPTNIKAKSALENCTLLLKTIVASAADSKIKETKEAEKNISSNFSFKN